MKSIIVKELQRCMDNLPTIPEEKSVFKEIEVNGGSLSDFEEQAAEIANSYSIEKDDISFYCSEYSSDMVASFGIKVKATNADKEKIKEKHFNRRAYKYIYDALTNAGYKRVGFNSGLLKAFNDTTIYKMFVNQEYDRLADYYSLSFIIK